MNPSPRDLAASSLEPGQPLGVPQHHDRYSADERRAWTLALRGKRRTLDRYAGLFDRAYLDGMAQLALSDADIPTEGHLNRRLGPAGWSVAFVDGYLPVAVYVELLLRRVFPVARNIRSLEHLDLSPVPDLVHDVLGHLPMLFCRDYRRYLQRVCELMRTARPGALDGEAYAVTRELSRLESLGETRSQRVAELEQRMGELKAALDADPSPMVQVERIFLWTIEFGLFGTAGEHRIYGAGLLSSAREIDAVSQRTTPVRPYTKDVIRHGVCFTGAQPQFFVASGYPAIHAVLTELIAEHGPAPGAQP